MAETALTLSTTDFDRPTVVIDGEPYQMRAEDELSVAMIRRLTALGEDLRAEGAELEHKAEAIAASVDVVMVDFPAEVRDKLTIRQQSKIIEVFSELARPKNDGGRAGGATSS
jgi:hypothetical protein